MEEKSIKIFRPKTVVVASILIFIRAFCGIVMGIILLIKSAGTEINPSGIIALLWGIGILKMINWTRIWCIIWYAGELGVIIIRYLFSPPEGTKVLELSTNIGLGLDLIFFIILLCLLFSKSTREAFSKRTKKKDE